MKRILSGFLLAALTICLFTACGGPVSNSPVFGAAGAPVPAGQTRAQQAPETSTSTAAISAGSVCALVTLAEVSDAAAVPMRVTADGGPIGECIYSATSDQSFVMYVSVDKSTADIDQRKQQIESLSEHVAGLGDDAFWNATIGEIFIQQGARALIIILPSLANVTNKPDANKQRLIILAKQALARL